MLKSDCHMEMKLDAEKRKQTNKQTESKCRTQSFEQDPTTNPLTFWLCTSLKLIATTKEKLDHRRTRREKQNSLCITESCRKNLTKLLLVVFFLDILQKATQTNPDFLLIQNLSSCTEWKTICYFSECTFGFPCESHGYWPTNFN